MSIIVYIVNYINCHVKLLNRNIVSYFFSRFCRSFRSAAYGVNQMLMGNGHVYQTAIYRQSKNFFMILYVLGDVHFEWRRSVCF